MPQRFNHALVVLLWLLAVVTAGAGTGRLGTAFDLQGFIDHEILAGKSRIAVPPGQYRVTPHDRQHLVLRNLKDIQIIADDV